MEASSRGSLFDDLLGDLDDDLGIADGAPESLRVEEPVAGGRKEVVLSVAQAAGIVRVVLEDAFDDITVEGELSNVHLHRSGHFYATLKDADAQIRVVLWRSAAARVVFRPRDGLLVRVRGRMSFYPARGEAQLVGEAMTLAGEGALAAAFEALKTSLAAEGLFDPSRKRPLPPFPRRIGVVTSPSGAAVRDVLAILAERFPLAAVLVCGVQVQGPGAADQIADALAAFSELTDGDEMRPDVIIVGRGGGSAEDLWAFNEEVVARAVAACPIPVVSAVGHETDVTICDFVADARAATPSHAAQMVAPDQREVAAHLATTAVALREGLRLRIAAARGRYTMLATSAGLRRVPLRIADARRTTERTASRIDAALAARLAGARARHAASAAALAALDPLAPLRRGYALVTGPDGRRVRAAALARGDLLRLAFADGAATATVTSTPVTSTTGTTATAATDLSVTTSDPPEPLPRRAV